MRRKFYLLVDLPNTGLKALMNWALRIKWNAGKDCSRNFIRGWTEFSLLRNEVPQEESHTGLTSENEENALKCWAGDIPIWDRNGESWSCSWICAPMGQEPLLSLLVFHEGWLAVPTLGSLGCGQSWRWSMTSWLASEINIILLLWPPASLDWLDSWQPWHCAQNTVCYNTPTTKCAFQFGAKSFGIPPPPPLFCICDSICWHSFCSHPEVVWTRQGDQSCLKSAGPESHVGLKTASAEPSGVQPLVIFRTGV